jgi:hypothetical protein
MAQYYWCLPAALWFHFTEEEQFGWKRWNLKTKRVVNHNSTLVIKLCSR